MVVSCSHWITAILNDSSHVSSTTCCKMEKSGLVSWTELLFQFTNFEVAARGKVGRRVGVSWMRNHTMLVTREETDRKEY